MYLNFYQYVDTAKYKTVLEEKIKSEDSKPHKGLTGQFSKGLEELKKSMETVKGIKTVCLFSGPMYSNGIIKW